MEVISYFFENFYFQVKTAVTLTPFVKPHLGNLINSTKHPKNGAHGIRFYTQSGVNHLRLLMSSMPDVNLFASIMTTDDTTCVHK